MITIYGRDNSINVRKVLWACAELNLATRREDWGIGFRSPREPQYLAMNPHALIPVIDDDGFILWESNSIIRYLANQHAGEAHALLYPADAKARARIDQWIDWQASELNPAWSYAYLGLMRASPAHQDPAMIAASLAKWNAHMTVLDQQLARTGAYVAGEAFTLADIPIGLSVYRWMKTPHDHPTLPAVAAYVERLMQREGYRAFGANGMP